LYKNRHPKDSLQRAGLRIPPSGTTEIGEASGLRRAYAALPSLTFSANFATVIFVLGILWIVLTICLYCAIVRLTKSLTPVHPFRVFLRAIFGTVAFAPTLVVLGFAAVPAPASLIISLALLHPIP
jgi:hypothetical protein